MRKAQRLVERLLEGTVIVLNAGNDSPSSDALLSQVKGLLNGETGPQPAACEPKEVVKTTSSGKKWNFRVNRDSTGNITSIEAQEH